MSIRTHGWCGFSRTKRTTLISLTSSRAPPTVLSAVAPSLQRLVGCHARSATKGLGTHPRASGRRPCDATALTGRSRRCPPAMSHRLCHRPHAGICSFRALSVLSHRAVWRVSPFPQPYDRLVHGEWVFLYCFLPKAGERRRSGRSSVCSLARVTGEQSLVHSLLI